LAISNLLLVKSFAIKLLSESIEVFILCSIHCASMSIMDEL